MTETKPNGGSAFPSREITMMNVAEDGSETPIYSDSPGMSLRDYYAGKVLAGFMSAKAMHFHTDDDAEYCFKVADAMLAARAK